MFENIFAGLNIDTNNPELADGFAPIPEGVYPVVLTSIEASVSNKGYNMIVAKIQIREGTFKGRNITHFFNIGHPSTQTVEIAKKDLATMARACGVNGQLTNPQQVINVPMFAKISPQKDSNFYRITAWFTPEAAARMHKTVQTPAAPQVAAPVFASPAQPAFAAPAQPVVETQVDDEKIAHQKRIIAEIDAKRAEALAKSSFQPAQVAPGAKMPWEQ